MATEKRLIDAHDLWSDIMMLPHNGDMISSEEVEQAIKDAPTVDAVEVVLSRFVRIADFGDGEGCFGYCERCGTVHHAQSPVALKADYRWCRWCGAKMDGDWNG
jgi:hypothetical protein